MSKVNALYMDERERAVEQRARELCIADGLDPDERCWDGDPDVYRGTRHWRQWQEYVEQVEEQLLGSGYLIGKPLHPAILMAGTDAPSQEGREKLLYSIPLRAPASAEPGSE